MAAEKSPGVLAEFDAGFHLLRSAPWRAPASYLLGAAPFFLSLFYFWTDMSESAFARQTAAGESLAVAAFYLWMCCWQSVFAGVLRQQVTGEPPRKWTVRRILRLIEIQAAAQASALFLLPAAWIILAPAPAVYAFYQHLTAYPADEEGGGIRAAARTASRQARRWGMQNLYFLLLAGLLAGFLFVNLALAVVMIPQFIKMLTGVETVFTQNTGGMINFTLVLICTGLTYMGIDPVVKAVYVLRGFRIDSTESGDDLRAGLTRVRRTGTAAASVLTALIVASGLAGAEPAKPVSPDELSRSIDEVLRKSEFAWRSPRIAEDRSQSKNPFVRFTEEAIRTVERWTRAALRWVDRTIQRIIKWLRGEQPSGVRGEPIAPPSANELRGLLWTLLALALLAIGIVWLRTRRKGAGPVQQARAVTLDKVDLTAEDVTADQLPEDGWLNLAQQYLDNQDYRTAIRALYLASLAYLGQRELIRIHKGKSNREYERELERRARGTPEVQPLFAQQVISFERSWYGLHEATREGFEAFRNSLSQMRVRAGE